MSAVGRKPLFDLLDFECYERPLWVKADVQIVAFQNAGSEWLLYPRNRTFS